MRTLVAGLIICSTMLTGCATIVGAAVGAAIGSEIDRHYYRHDHRHIDRYYNPYEVCETYLSIEHRNRCIWRIRNGINR